MGRKAKGEWLTGLKPRNGNRRNKDERATGI